MSRSKLCENGPEIVEKKNTLLHIVSRTQRPEKIKKFDPSGVLYAGSSGILINFYKKYLQVINLQFYCEKFI
jgi:hypothetical protein